MDESPRLLSKKDAACLLGVSERTLDRWHAFRVGPARITAGRRVLYRIEAVTDWLRANETAPINTFQS